MNRLQENILFIVLVAFVTSFSMAQTTSSSKQHKIILSSKVENGYRIEHIREGNHEYILRTPLELVEDYQPITQDIPQAVVENRVFDTNSNYITYVAPEMQTPELIQNRLLVANVGIPLDYNADVQVEIEKYLKHRGLLENALGRAQYFMPQIETVIHSKGLPTGLKYLPLVESNYKPKSYSRAGARGLWQFMKGTARLYELKVDSSIDERLNPELSTEAAATFLTDLYDRFGDWHLALAAYNCGPGRVQRAINASEIENPTFWDIQDLLPRETKRYVPKFIAANYIMEHASEIGLLPSLDGYEMAQAQTQDLQESNFKTSTPKTYSSSAIPANSTLLTYTVKSGDSLGFIAEWYDTSAGRIRGWNNISGNLIKPGQKLKVYVPSHKKKVYAKIDQLPSHKKNEQVVMASTVVPNKNDTRTFVKYKIQKGDTLWDISRKNGISIEEIKTLNNITNTKNLMPGMVLKIREKS